MQNRIIKWHSFIFALVIGLSINFGLIDAAYAAFQVIVNPIQVCDDSGTICANINRELFLEETDKIWAQADIDIMFLDWKVMNSSEHLSGSTLGQVSSASGNQEMGNDVINMWFVQSIDGGSFGVANRPGNNIIISDSIFSYSGGNGRRDTIAHEIGHNLNLPHIAGDFPLNVMEEGGNRSASTSIGQIFPDGSMRDQLNQSQINIAQSRSLVNTLDFSIPGDANLDNVVNQTDVEWFVAGWLHSQTDPDINSWQKGDFNLDGNTSLADAFILHQALKNSGQGGLDLSALKGGDVPEPSSIALGLLTCIGLLALRKKNRR